LYQTYYHNQLQRTEFRLESNHVYNSDMRLVDVQAGSDGTYQYGAGAYALIKNIYLYDDNILIDQCYEAGYIASLENMLNENRRNRDLWSYSVKSSIGYTNVANPVNNASVVDSLTALQTGKGNVASRLELRPLLGFLAFNQLFQLKMPRLVIEWNTSAHDVFILADSAKIITIPAPTLIVDDLIGAPNVPMPQSYLSYELDRITQPLVATNVIKKTKFRVNGFDKKRVGRLLLINKGDYNAVMGDYKSHAQWYEEIQLYVNDSPFLPSPITRFNKQSYMNDAYGNMNFPIGLNYVAFEAGDGTANSDLLHDVNIKQYEHTQSWGVVDFKDQIIPDLQVEYTRGGGTLGVNASVMLLIGEVARQLSKDANGNAVVAND